MRFWRVKIRSTNCTVPGLLGEQLGGPAPSEDNDLLRQLLAQAQGSQVGQLASIPGDQLGQQQGIGDIGTTRLIEAMRQSRQGGNVNQRRNIRDIVESRSNPVELQQTGPAQPGLTTAEPEKRGIFDILNDALSGRNRGQDLRDERREAQNDFF